MSEFPPWQPDPPQDHPSDPSNDPNRPAIKQSRPRKRAWYMLMLVMWLLVLGAIVALSATIITNEQFPDYVTIILVAAAFVAVFYGPRLANRYDRQSRTGPDAYGPEGPNYPG